MQRALIVASLSLVAMPAAHAQVVNGDFETGSLPPWTLVNTPSGRSVFSDVPTYDIDGAGPLPPSRVSRVMAGQQQSNSGAQGVVLTQTITLAAGRWRVRAHWATHALISTNVTSGQFELLIDGVAFASHTAAVLTSNQRDSGVIQGEVEVAQGGDHVVGVRITRPITAGAEVWQHVDNVILTPVCDPDYNQDGNADQDDVAYLVNVIGGGDNPTGRDPDFNGDGNADQDDVMALINVLAGGGCP
jgi:hypothetical protein